MRIFNRRSNNGTTVIESNALLQTGWGALQLTGGSGSVQLSNVTFPIAYQNVPVILVNFGGDQAGGTPALGNGGNTVEGQVTIKHFNDTTTGTVIYMNSPTGAWPINSILYYTWIAIGV